MLEDTRDAIFSGGHRAFVGGDDDFFWRQIGALQFDFLCAQGLRPDHVLFDVACGCLRGGVHFIRYLAPGNYVGFDKFIELVILGVGHELGLDVYASKKPRFRIGENFDFSGTGVAPNYAIAQSLFTHLTAADIRACLRGLAAVSPQGMRFYATFFETQDAKWRNPAASHSHGFFAYTAAEMAAFGAECGFAPRYIGDWTHPRGQRMMEYVCAA